MSDYTPTTEEIQSRYVYAADFTVSEEVDAWSEFDRWLAAHDAEMYQRGREDERNEHRIQGEGQVPFVARGDGEQA